MRLHDNGHVKVALARVRGATGESLGKEDGAYLMWAQRSPTWMLRRSSGVTSSYRYAPQRFAVSR